jgi:hypothetical protein
MKNLSISGNDVTFCIKNGFISDLKNISWKSQFERPIYQDFRLEQFDWEIKRIPILKMTYAIFTNCVDFYGG